MAFQVTRAAGRLQHVATLTWRLSDGKTAWVDRVYSSRGLPTWVERTDHEYQPGSVSWGRVEAAFALDIVLSAIQEPPEVTDSRAVTSRAAPALGHGGDAPPGFDGSSFAWGAGLAGVPAALLALAVGWRRQRSVTASRKPRVSAAAAS